jgi:hypothetical protein
VSIQNSGREIVCQRRNGLLESQEQHYGFVSFVQKHQKYFLSLYHRRNLLLDNLAKNNEFQDTKNNINPAYDITIFGEWCGKNIMQGAAICNLPRNIFAVFAIEVLFFSLTSIFLFLLDSFFIPISFSSFYSDIFFFCL